MSKKIILFLFCLLAACRLLYAGPAGEKCFLWEVHSDNAKVYLLGSIHILKPNIYPLDDRIEEAFRNSDTLVVEANVDQAGLLEQAAVLEKAIYQGNDSLKNHLSKYGYERMSGELSAMGLDIGLFDQFKPWFIGMQMTVMSLMQLGYDPSYGIDMYFLNQAQQSKKVEELESIEYQVNLMNGMSDQVQELFMLASVKDLATLQEEMDSYVAAWLSGDKEALENNLFRGMAEHPEISELYEQLFFQRNRSMASKIEGLLSRGGNYFVIVGAGHLVGQDGILRLLEEKGFSPHQI